MNHLAIQQKSFAATYRSMEKKEHVVCPKPRRLALLHATLTEPSQVRPLHCHSSLHQEVFDAKAGNELLDIILTKGSNTNCDSSQPAEPIASSPPFFCGSPPSRVSNNPLIQDSQFGNTKFTMGPPRTIPTPLGPAHFPSSSACKPGNYSGANFGNNPVFRVEGFECLDRDRIVCFV
ncbi:translation initiation factor IF-2 [Striga asiatica]|uniref:Translation initiation factor IF-2 n=1 Tax=Striga asiatica TaxID=4170 RepID=A0A5A7PJ37_STRAF|nr:translation initiation factor IF-2 [Striga asiatica]